LKIAKKLIGRLAIDAISDSKVTEFWILAMQNRSNRPDQPLFKPWHLLVLVLLGFCGVIYSYGVMQKAYTFDPEKTYAEFFTNSRDRIKELKGDGTISSMSDVWLTFYSADIIRFRQPQFVSVERPDRAWHYFSSKFPDDKNVFNLSDLEAWSYYDHPDQVRLINGWLLHNKKNNYYWFRTWGRK
jgi:hypothetical protein